jgi:hypothetical protein
MRMNRQYERERGELEEDLQTFAMIPRDRPMALLLVRDVDPKTIHALQYAKTLRAQALAVHLEDDPMHTLLLEAAWHQAGLQDDVPLRIARGGGDEAERLAGFVGALPVERDVTVLVPVAHDIPALERLSESRDGTKLTRALLPYEHVRVTLVRDHPDGVHPLSHDEFGNPVVKLAPRGMHISVVAVDKLDRAVLRAIAYALTLGATEVRAVHAALDPERGAQLAIQASASGVPVALDIIECWDRNVPRTLEEEVMRLGERGAEVTVVMPRRDFPRLRQRLLHDRTSRHIMRRLGHHPHVDVTSVPYYFAPKPKTSRPVSPPSSVG